MVSGQTKRYLQFDPDSFQLTWQDRTSDFLTEELRKQIPILKPDLHRPQSFRPTNPIGKTKNLRLLKIQVGYGCNFKCTFCSQASTRSSQNFEALNPATFPLIDKLQDLLRDHPAESEMRIEFWGGETLIYWSTVETLAREIRKRWPKIQLLLFTNGSLLKREIVESLVELRVHVVISHEGAKQLDLRGREVPEKSRKLIQELHQRLFPYGLLSFNMTLGKDNFRLKETRRQLSQFFEIPLNEVLLNFDVLMIFDEMSRRFHLKNPVEIQEFTRDIFNELKSLGLESNWIPFLRENILDFLTLLAHPRPSLFQKCSMDRPDSLAIDMKGNVLTCQNTTAASGHKIGHLDQFDEISLSTSTHWTRRESCQKCPVVALCRGSCMYLEGELFDQTCDNYFAFYSGLLAYILYELSGFELHSILGTNIRSRNLHRVPILEMP